jgi:hypothetical protein
MQNKTNPTTLKPDFNHRLSILGDEASSLNVSDAVSCRQSSVKSYRYDSRPIPGP